MIVEWILRANGASEWQFSKKLKAYDQLVASGTLVSPILLAPSSALAKPFWALYRYLVPFRGTVVHAGGVVLESDGTVKVTRGANVLDLTPTQQASYLRAMCLLGKLLSTQLSPNAFLRALIESDFCELASHHKQLGLTRTTSRLALLEVEVPTSMVRMAPVAFDVDFDQLRLTMEKTYTAGISAQVYFSVTICTDVADRRLTWVLPFESIPSGTVTIAQGDPQFDGFLKIEVPSQKAAQEAVKADGRASS
jgi:hypothetical protein